MATTTTTTTTNKVSSINVVSFSNTPQAGDDRFTGLNEDFSGVKYFSVMANDLGGAAKTLWSLDDGSSSTTSTKIYAPADLLTQDTARTEELSTDKSACGAKIWITSDGKVGYDTNTDAFKDAFQSLAAGEIGYDKFTYAIRLGNGTLSWATATVEITGVNDGPMIISHTDGSLIEDGSNPTLSTTGTIAFDDVDLTDTHTVSVSTDSDNTLGGTLTASVTDAVTAR